MSSVMIIVYNILQTYSEGLKLNILNFNFTHHALQIRQYVINTVNPIGQGVSLFAGFKEIVY